MIKCSIDFLIIIRVVNIHIFRGNCDASIGGAWFDSQSHSQIFVGCYHDHAILATWGCSMSDFTQNYRFSAYSLPLKLCGPGYGSKK